MEVRSSELEELVLEGVKEQTVVVGYNGIRQPVKMENLNIEMTSQVTSSKTSR